MLKGKLLHPQMLSALGKAGHTSRILIADGNFPFSAKCPPGAELVSLNLMPGLVSCTQVLDALLASVPFEAAHVMDYARTGQYALDGDPPIWAEYRKQLDDAGYSDMDMQKIERFAFYDQVASPDVAMVVATGDQRIYANLLLTVGVVMPE